MTLRKTIVRILTAVALAASVAAASAPLGPAGHAGPAQLVLANLGSGSGGDPGNG